MAEFYGQIKGAGNTTATKTGTKKSGIAVSAQSYNGSVIVSMLGDMVTIDIAEGSSMWGKTYFWGTIDELKKVLAKAEEGDVE